MKVLITGTAGFIGSNFVRRFLDDERYSSHKLVGVDKIVKDYNIKNLYEHENYKFYLADIANEHTMDRIFSIEMPDVVINLAAESFVDNSITDISPFLQTNVIGMQTIINCCLRYSCTLVHTSTDEVYGSKANKEERPWIETDPLKPRNPYSASKACSEHIIIAAHNTHNLFYQITRSCNVFGPRQKAENLIPHIIHSLRDNKPIHIHGNGQNFRQYIFVDDVIDGIIRVNYRGRVNNVYNIGDHNFYTNLEMVEKIAKLMNKTPNIQFMEDRKAHDFGYNVNSDKLREIGWRPSSDAFEDKLLKTIDWYIAK